MKQSKKQQELEERYRKLSKENERLDLLVGNLLGPFFDFGEEFAPTKEEWERMANILKEHKAEYGTDVARREAFIEYRISKHPKISEADIMYLETKNAQYRYKILSRYQTPSLQNEQLIFLQKLKRVTEEYYMVSDFGELSLPPDINPEELKQLYAENVEKYGSWETYVKQCHAMWKSDYVFKNLRELKMNAELTAFVEPNTYEQQLINLVIQLNKVCKEHIKETLLGVNLQWSEKFDKGSQSGDYNIDILCELWNKIQDVGEQLIARNDLKNYSDNPFNRYSDTIKNEKIDV